MGPYMHDGDYHAGFGAGHWFLMVVGFIIFVGIVTLAVLAVIKYLNDRPTASATASTSLNTPTPTPTPLDVLQMRLAQGDISEDEYRSRLAALNG